MGVWWGKSPRVRRKRRSAVMEEITLEQLPRKMRDLYEKALSAMERGNTGYAVDMLGQVAKTEPRFLAARRSLRVAQVKAFLDKKPSAMTHQLAGLKGSFTLMGGQGKLKKDPQGALEVAEKLMALDPLHLPFLKFFAQAAEACEMPMAAVQTLEVAKPHFARDVDFLRTLAKLYQTVGNMGGAKDCLEAVMKLKPGDQQALKDYKDASALASIKTGNWDEKGDFRKKLKDKKEAQRLEQEHRSVKGESDIGSLIESRKRDIAREPQNMNFRRALADLYVQAGQFDDALQALEDATKAAGRSDPQIERTMSAIKVKRYDAQIAAAKEAGDAAAEEKLEGEKAQFVYDDAVTMAKRYPNDLGFRYDLGVQYYLRKMYTEAIEEFQLARRNPQRRTRALYYLALCFSEKGQLDIAFEQLQTAAGELTLMDETKKDIVYEMGLLAQQMGKGEEAKGYFKEIYAVDIKYKDVQARIEGKA